MQIPWLERLQVIFFTTLMLLSLLLGLEVLAQDGVNLTLRLTSSDVSVPVNSNVSYTLTVENLGTQTATFVTVTDSLPAGLAFVSSQDACVVAEAVVTCAVGDLLPGESIVLTYIVRAHSVGETVSNTVSVSSTETDSDSSNNVASFALAVVVPESVDIALLVSAIPAVLDISGTLTITFTALNTNSTASLLTQLTLSIPAQLTFVSSTACEQEDSIVRCELGTVQAASSETATLTLRAVVAGDAINISGTVFHAGSDPNEANDTASQAITINDPPSDSTDLDLSISSSAQQYTVGSAVVLTYTVINRGPGTASRVVIRDPLVADLSFLTSPDCTFEESEITCEVGTLAVNTIYVGSVTVSAQVATPALSNAVAVAGAEFDPNLFNNVQTLVLSSVPALTATAQRLENAGQHESHRSMSGCSPH